MRQITTLRIKKYGPSFVPVYNRTYIQLILIVPNNTAVHKSWAPDYDGEYILYSGAKHLGVFSMALASCHPSGAYNLEEAPKLKKKKKNEHPC